MRNHADHKLHVLLVCTANVCRSPLAEAILRTRLDDGLITVRSAGLRAAAPQPACQVASTALANDLAARRVLFGHTPEQFHRKDIGWADLIITAERAQRVHIIHLMPTVRGHVFTLNEGARLIGPARESLAAPEGDDSLRRIVHAMNRLRGRLPAPQPAASKPWYRQLRHREHPAHADDILDTHGGPFVPHDRTTRQVVAAATTIAAELSRTGARSGR